ncbi:hypothetical protein GCM10022255_057780 [Dactylosporangium darangshiense]|uniref:Chitin-binding type-3 domain-containing protein n=1 Tax=Dactylosporangium darangshiense TaxID=579108 RepID=A0ABP8DEQ7_9ACTN
MGRPYGVSTPCSTHEADQPPGSTWTFMRRRQCVQYRGGSNCRATAQESWEPLSSGSPQRSQ